MAFTISNSGIDYIVDLVRFRISDPKYIYSNVTFEDAGTASGVNNELFYTDNLPIASGFDTQLRVGRWYYTKYDTDGACAGLRGYTFNIESGSFKIPTSAVLAESGARTRVSYTWIEEQPFKFSDREIKYYISDAVTTVNQTWNDFGYRTLLSGSDVVITPSITVGDFAAHVYALYVSYLIKKQLESEGFGDRIYVQDINITIDTSKGLSDLQKSSQNLYDSFKGIIYELRIKGQEAAFRKIDTYSTYNDGDYRMYDQNYTQEREFF